MKAWPVVRRIMTYFWVAALLLTAVTVARYTTLVAGSGSAEIAIPVVKMTGSGSTALKLKDEIPQVYSFSVSNNKSVNGTTVNSDVDMTYSVLVTVPKALSLELTALTIATADTPVVLPAPTKTESGGNYIYTYTASSMRLPAGVKTTHNFKLTVKCKTIGVEETGNISIDVKAIQAK